MILWSTVFHTLRPIASLPRLRMVAKETVDSADYRHSGRYRQSEQHSIFKITLKGEGVFRDASGEHRVTAGSGFLVEISDPDTAYYYPSDATEPWTFFYAAFDGQSATAMVRDMTARYGPVYQLAETHPALQRVMDFRGERDRAQRSVTPFQGAYAVWNLLGALAASKETSDEPRDLPLLIRKAQTKVAEHLDRNLNASELAGLLSVSREHLSRRFKEETGMTPHVYIVREKMLYACRLLKDTDLSLKEIAGRLGYCEAAHFSRTFRRVLDMTPSRFREAGSIPLG